VFTQELVKRCMAAGMKIMFDTSVERIEVIGKEVSALFVRNRQTGVEQRVVADEYVVAGGSYSAPLLRTVGVDLPIYPGKGYSATLPILKPNAAPEVSVIDDELKIAISRLGNELRVAGTIELNGYSHDLDSPLAQARCRMLVERIETVLPGVCDTRTEAQGGKPNFWTGLRPATPTNIPYIGKAPIRKLWVNAGHGTLGWTHGAGSGRAMADLINGEKPELASFKFYGY
jgi:D-amino-acid dehydrogenase